MTVFFAVIATGIVIAVSIVAALAVLVGRLYRAAIRGSLWR